MTETESRDRALMQICARPHARSILQRALEPTVARAIRHCISLVRGNVGIRARTREPWVRFWVRWARSWLAARDRSEGPAQDIARWAITGEKVPEEIIKAARMALAWSRLGTEKRVWLRSTAQELLEYGLVVVDVVDEDLVAQSVELQCQTDDLLKGLSRDQGG